MRALIIFFLLTYTNFCSGQSYFSKLFVKKTPYGGFVTQTIEVKGFNYLSLNTSFDWQQNIGLIGLDMTNSVGDSIWHKEYGEPNSVYEQSKIVKTNDSSYVFCGYEYQNGYDTSYAFIMKINEKGDSIWKKKFSHHADDFNYFSDIILTHNNGLLAVGLRNNNENPLDTAEFQGDRQGYILKTDLDGNEEWHTIFGDNVHDETIFSVVELPNRNYAIAGRLFNISTLDFDAFLYIIDTLGNIIKKSVMSFNKYSVVFSTIKITNDNNILIGGEYSQSEKIFGNLRKTGCILAVYDMDGKPLWNKGYLDEVNQVMIQDILILENGDFLAVGHKSTAKAYILKFSPSGDIIWNRRLDHNQGTDKFHSTLYDICSTSDGMYLCSGNASYLPDTLTGIIRTVPWLCKIDSNGCVLENCLEGLSTELEKTRPRVITAFPNPFSENINLKFPEDMLHEDVTIILTDIQGKIKYKSSGRVENEISLINLQSQLSQGVYIISIQNKKRIKQIKMTHI